MIKKEELKMIIQDTRDKVLSLVDEKTVRRLRTSLDYVIKTEDNGILLSSRWIDNSPMLIYSTSSETHFWAKNKDIRELAKDADDSKGNELFGLLIAIATYDLAALNDLDDQVISFEESLFDGKGVTGENFASIHAFRNDSWAMRRYFERMEMLTTDLAVIDPSYSFIDSKYDKLLNHCLRTQEYLDQIRQAYEAQIGIEQNNLMKFFTVVTSIFLPLSLIAGWYGMNLIMPEFGWAYSYPFVIALSVGIIAIMLWLFRKNKWL